MFLLSPINQNLKYICKGNWPWSSMYWRHFSNTVGICVEPGGTRLSRDTPNWFLLWAAYTQIEEGCGVGQWNRKEGGREIRERKWSTRTPIYVHAHFIHHINTPILSYSHYFRFQISIHLPWQSIPGPVTTQLTGAMYKCYQILETTLPEFYKRLYSFARQMTHWIEIVGHCLQSMTFFSSLTRIYSCTNSSSSSSHHVQFYVTSCNRSYTLHLAAFLSVCHIALKKTPGWVSKRLFWWKFFWWKFWLV